MGVDLDRFVQVTYVHDWMLYVDTIACSNDNPALLRWCRVITLTLTGELPNMGVTLMANLKHGHAVNGKTTLTYNSWKAMLDRCLSEWCPDYQRYGARGIQVCNRWLHFANFLEDMGERPIGTTLDRIDNTGNYEPGNCQWATSTVQHKDQRKLTDSEALTIYLDSRPNSVIASEHGVRRQVVSKIKLRQLYRHVSEDK